MSLLRQDDSTVKPILLVTVDGGPDEHPRFPKTLAAWTKAFKRFDLDLLVVAAHAPGQSAFNTVERRMAPLSKQLVMAPRPKKINSRKRTPSTTDESVHQDDNVENDISGAVSKDEEKNRKGTKGWKNPKLLVIGPTAAGKSSIADFMHNILSCGHNTLDDAMKSEKPSAVANVKIPSPNNNGTYSILVKLDKEKEEEEVDNEDFGETPQTFKPKRYTIQYRELQLRLTYLGTPGFTGSAQDDDLMKNIEEEVMKIKGVHFIIAVIGADTEVNARLVALQTFLQKFAKNEMPHVYFILTNAGGSAFKPRDETLAASKNCIFGICSWLQD